MKTMKNKKMGISLIVLVITIIVMIILATVVVLTLSNSGIISKANKAVDATDLANMQDLATMLWADKYLDLKEDGVIDDEDLADLRTAVETGLSNADKNYASKYNVEVTINGVTLKTQTSEQARVVEFSYSCGRKDIDIIPVGGYSDPIDYWLSEELNDEQRKRVLYIMAYNLTGFEGVIGILNDLKANGITLFEYLGYPDVNLSEAIYSIYRTSVYKKGFTWMSFMAKIGTVHNDNTKKVDDIFEFYSILSGKPSTDLDEVLSYILNTPVTVSELTTNYDISEASIIDILYLKLFEESGGTFNDFLTDESNPLSNLLWNEENNKFASAHDNAKTMVVTLPNGETRTTNEVITYTIDEPGDYEFTVVTEGKINNYRYSSSNYVEHDVHQEFCPYCTAYTLEHWSVDEDYDGACDVCGQ